VSFTSFKVADVELTDEEKSLVFVSLNEFLCELRWERLNSGDMEKIEGEEEEKTIAGLMARMMAAL